MVTSQDLGATASPSMLEVGVRPVLVGDGVAIANDALGGAGAFISTDDGVTWETLALPDRASPAAAVQASDGRVLAAPVGGTTVFLSLDATGSECGACLEK